MTEIQRSETHVRIRLETDEDVWFWERRFNVFDFLDVFPSESIAPAAEGDAPSPRAPVQLTVNTDAGFAFETDIVRGGFYLRSQSHGTRKWMSARNIRAGDTIVIERTGGTTFSLSKESPSGAEQ